MNFPQRRVFVFIILFLPCFLQSEAFAQRPYKYNVEFNSGRITQGVWMHYDSTYGVNEFITSDNSPKQNLKSFEVKRIMSISDPIRPPHVYEWTEFKDPSGTANEGIPKPPQECDCNGYDREDATYFLDTRLGLNGKGNSTYTFSTANGPQTVTSKAFSPGNIGSTNFTVEAEVAAGWIVGKFDLGLMLAVIPTDGFVYFPLGLHGRYYFQNNCCSITAFADAGLPLDFGTHTPVFLSPVTSDRQRRYFDIGLGKIWPFSESMRFAIDLGYRYMVIPLAEIDCCPTIVGSDRFPARKSHAGFLQIGFSF